MRVFSSASYIVLLLATISACAKDPDNIAAVRMEDTTYSGLNCQQLQQEELQQWQKFKSLCAAQENAQTGDALGVLLLGLPVSTMTGGDKETDIAVCKGRLDAIDRQQAAKRCPATAVDAEKAALMSAAADNNK